MHAVIIGGGKFGARLVSHLAEHNWDVVLIERDEEIAEEITEKYGIMVLKGDGTKIELLKQAGIEKADVFVAATGVEEVNVISGLIAKKYGIGKVIVRIGNADYKEILEGFSIDYVLLPEVTAADYVFDVVISTELESVNQIPMKGGARIISFVVPSESDLVGMKIKDIKIKEGEAGIMSILRKKTNKMLIPVSDDVIDEEDTVYIITNEKYMDKLAKIFH
ncbi:NAD-binding protein [Candidatus Micrarchaeota archaeon]|nr:NAD-binding protein [Candidatus Micrarchaeota archaeon]